MTVIKLLDKAEYVWRCNCGNCGFTIHESGRIQCCECNKYQDGPVVDMIPHFQTIKRKVGEYRK